MRNRSVKIFYSWCVVFLFTGPGVFAQQPGSLIQRNTRGTDATEHRDIFGTAAYFIENVGQYGSGPSWTTNMGMVRFGFQGFDMPVLFTEKGVIFLERKQEKITEKERDLFEKKEARGVDGDDQEASTHIVTMQWLGANPHPKIIAGGISSSYFSFGMLPVKARGYTSLTYEDLYPGIDISYFFSPHDKAGFEYSITVRPGGDISRVKMLFDGNLKPIRLLPGGSMRITSDINGFEESAPAGFYEDKVTQRIPVSFHKEKNIISFTVGKYDRSRTVVIDPFVSAASNLLGLNAGKAKDIDYDYAGNLYVSGGGDGATNHMLAKYDANGILQWTFSGILATPSWQFGTYYGGWVVEKTTGNVYLGQGFEYADGFSIIRLNTAGIYDNYITTANPSFREDWKMYWMCNGGSPQILIAGGGTNSNINFGICTPPSTTISSLNITGIPYTGADGWAQDISDIVIDPVNSDVYTIYGSLYGTPALSNKIYKNKAPYSAASLQWNVYSGFVAIQEIANRPFLAGSAIDNSSNVLAVNSSYFFYWDGRNLKAFDKATGATKGTPLTIAANQNLMSGGIVADECNNIFVGSTNGTIKVYKFNGSIFDDAAEPDISIPGYGSKSVYDIAYNESQKLLYASGDGFVASFDISAYACPATTYNLNITANCAAGTATVAVSPTPPAGSTVTYVLFDGNTQIGSNNTGSFTGLTAGTVYTVKVYVNQVCSGTLTISNFVLPGPLLALSKTDATCGNLTGSISATGSNGTAPYTYSKDGVTFQPAGTFSGLPAGLYIITVKDAGGCKTADSIIIKNTDGPVLGFVKTDATCSNSDGTITALGSGGTPPLQYSINGTIFQAGTVFTGLAGGNYALTVKDATGCMNVVNVTIADFPGPQFSVTPTSTTCNNNNGSIAIYATGGTAPLQYSINGNIFQAGNVFNNLASGNYTVVVKDANGCTRSQIVTVAASPGPTVIATATIAACNNTNGSITATGTGVEPLQYSINGVFYQTSNIFTGLAAGSYTITVKDANGCTNTTTITVNNSSGPSASAFSSPASCNTANGSITVSATGTGPFLYSINGFTFQGSNTFNGLVAGNYVVYVKDAAGCIGTTTVAISNTAGPQVTAITTPASCAVDDGTITATGAGGAAPLLYSIDGVTYQPGNSFNGLPEGNYTVMVKDANNCTATTVVTIKNASGLSIAASSIATSCAGNNGSITVTATGGVAPIQYSIDGLPFQAGNTFNSLSPGAYLVSVRDANSCLVSDSVIVGSSSGLTLAVVTSNSCSNKNGSITATGSGGSPPLSYSINGTSFQSSGFFYGLTPGNYTVTVKDASGCTTTTSATISNVAGAGPTVTAKFHDAHSCSGDAQGRIDNISASGGTPPYLFSINGGPFSSNTTYFVFPGVYTITAKDANGCTSTVKGTITDVPAPTVTAVTTATPCGLSTGTIKATGHGGQTPYRYSLNGGPFQSSGTFTGLPGGNYTITVIDDEDCTGSVQVTVLNTGGPAVTVTKTDGTCGLANGTITATGTGGTGQLTYRLNNGSYQTSGVFTGLAAGTYNITVKDATGCTGGATVTVNNAGGPGISTAIKDATCNNDNGSIAVTVTGGTAPLKYSIDGTIFQGTNTFNNLPPGNYTVTVLDAAGCYAKSGVTVGKIPLPKVSAFTIPASCNNKDGSIIVAASGGTVPYTFSLDGIVFQSSNSFNGLGAGFYTITVRDSNNCVNTTAIAVSNATGPQLTVTTIASTCGKANGVITATGSGGTAPLQYSIDGTTFQAANVFNNLTPGMYTVVARDASNCMNTVSVLVGYISGPQQPVVKVVNASCGNSNGVITVAATGGVPPLQFSIDGTTFQAGNVFPGLAANNYTLTVKDANGCTNTTGASVENFQGPMASATATGSSCGSADGVIVVTTTGGTLPLQYSINGVTFQVSNIFGGVSANNYTVTVKDANGCTGTTNVIVNGGSGATLSASSVAATCSSSNGSITATAVGGTAPFQYSIDGTTFQASNVFGSLAANNYIVTVKDANGCISTTNVTVGSIGGATLTANTTSATCGSSNGSITATAVGGTAPFQYSIDGTTFQASNVFGSLAANNYTVTVKDTNGCISTTNVTVSLINSLYANAGSDIMVCEGTTTQLNASSDATGFLWQPSTGLSDATILKPFAKPLVTTTYILTATSGSCAQKDSVTVFVNPLPQANAGKDTVVCYGGSAQLHGSGGVSYTWLPSTNLSNPYISNPTAIHLFDDITYILLVSDGNGCKSGLPDTVHVAVIPRPILFAGRDTAVAINQPLQLSAVDISASGFTTYSWVPATGLNNPRVSNPVAVLNANVTYLVTATTPEGCTATDDIYVKVYTAPDLYVPTAFTPNGDGVNDDFKPIPVGIKEFKYFSVYNKFGQLVFRTTTQLKGWDGTFNGKKQDSGTFVWQVEAIDYNGNVLYKKGTVVLIR